MVTSYWSTQARGRAKPSVKQPGVPIVGKIPTTPSTPTKNTYTNATPATYSQPTYSPPTVNYSGGGGYAMPAIKSYDVNLSPPNLSWSPTAAMRGEWSRLAQMRAENKYTPMLTAIADELSDYTRQAEANRADVLSQNVANQLALANVVKNTMKQDVIDAAIRRGAETSGWLPSMLSEAGKYETETRTGIQKETNRVIENIANALLGKQEEVSQRRTDIETAKANEILLDEKEQEMVAKNDYISNELAKWDAQYKIAALEAQVAESQNNLAYQYAALNAQREAESASNSLAQAKYELDKQWQNYQMNKQSYTTAAPTYTYNLGGTPLSGLSASQYANLYMANQPKAETYQDKINALIYADLLRRARGY